MRGRMRVSKRVLLASVSSAALAMSSPVVMAADVPDIPSRPPAIIETPVVPVSVWTFWMEGGRQMVNGDDAGVFGSNPGFVATKKTAGWNAAGGFDYRFDPVWHVSGAFRYGENKGGTTTASRRAIFPVAAVPIPGVPIPPTTACITNCVTVIPPPVTPPPVNKASIGIVTATRDEINWAADFMIGRDIGIGTADGQLKAGVRVAEIRGKTQGSVSWRVPTSTATTAGFVVHTRSFTQENLFLGAGPRLALEGSAPIAGGWFLDYMAGVAGLYSIRSFDQIINIANNSGAALTCIAGCPLALTSVTDGWVLNADVMLGVGYAFTPFAKLSVNYHGDAYFNALRIVDTNNTLSYANRTYHSVNLRLTLSH
jgi:hypothetical protein